MVVIALGLGSRKFASLLPHFIADHAGDALWTAAVYLTLAIAFPKWSPCRLGILSFGVSVMVEFSQLIDASWLNAIRATLPGKLLLGAGFLWIDLVRYLVGAVTATTLDWLMLGIHSRESR